MRKSYRTDFEDVYLKWTSLSGSKKITDKHFKEFDYTIKCVANKAYIKYSYIFKSVGFEKEDIVNISRCYLMAYINLYSIQENDHYKNKFIQKYMEKNGTIPTARDFKKKDNSNFMSFLSQRLSNCALVCNKKNNNIIMSKKIQKKFIEEDGAVPLSNPNILVSKYNKHAHKELGYKQLTGKEWNKMRNKGNLKHHCSGINEDLISTYEEDNIKKIILPKIQNNVQYINGNKVYVVDVDPIEVNSEQYTEDVLDDENSMDTMCPEQLAILHENGLDVDIMMKKFNKLDTKERFHLLQNFIKQYKDNIYYRDEIRTARKMLIKIRKEMA